MGDSLFTCREERTKVPPNVYTTNKAIPYYQLPRITFFKFCKYLINKFYFKNV